MRRSVPLLALVAAVIMAACVSPTGPRRDDPDIPPDSSEFCEGVTVGTHTRCDEEPGSKG